MTIHELQTRKKELRYTNEMIAEMSGVPLGTVQKIFAGITTHPRRETLQKLERILDRPVYESVRDPHPISHSSLTYGNNVYANYTGDSTVNEEPAVFHAYPRQGSYTLEDYYALPDDRRVELIDGVIYDMTSPIQIHQAILGRLHYEFVECVDRHPECELFLAPSDVRLDNDNRTMVQPDLFIVCGRTDQDFRRLNGAPDFVCEILSPSNRSYDMLLKYNKYKNAGVREYWIIDPDRLQVIVHIFDKETPPRIYTFHDVIPVGISGGECSIDFEKIFVKIQRYI